jgi:acetyl-CoA C-acetyltransferase
VPELDPEEIEDLVLGCGLPGGEQGFNMGRVVSVLLGLDLVPGTTITRYCASSLQAARMAFHAIRAGEGVAYIAAGVESVSSYERGCSDRLPPHLQAGEPDWKNPRFTEARAVSMARALGESPPWRDPRSAAALPDVYIAMGQTAENVAELHQVSRKMQDDFAVRSQNRAEKAIADGFWARDITPVSTPDGSVVGRDDGPRPGVTREGLAKLAPVFRPDGTVTAGNCCPLNDGAAALVIMSDERAAELGIAPLARIVATGVTGLSPEIMGLGPVEASRTALRRAGMTMKDIDLVEINEAFAAQVIPSARELGIDEDRLNVHGGAIAVGHPYGMTGARITTTLLHALQARDATTGLVTMCVGGGQGMAMIVDRLS